MDEGALPLDVVHEIPLHLPAKPLCRFRAVCRPWRRLLSDPLFMAAHGARHPGPHLIASYICNTEHDILLSILPSWLPTLSASRHCKMTPTDLLNPSTGAVYHMLDQLAQEHIDRGLELRDYSEPVHLFGLAAGKGEYKVLRMLIRFAWNGAHQYLFEVCTLGRNRGARWRAKQAPPMPSMWDKCARVVIDGVVYLLNVDVYYSFNSGLHVTEKDWIVSFDLETEEWRPNIRGPSSLLVGAAAVDMLECLNGRAGSRHIALTNLNGSLVIVLAWSSCMDMWFLMDSEEGLWVKQYSMQVAPYKNHRLVRPLLLLDDGRIVVHITNMRLLQIYDPRSNNFTDVVRLSHCWEVSMYTGNLLTLDGHNQ
ncbi:unnamed protein product [Urochloa decumbens]|uniref:F-box domain-containing protein n=1 Tax=Urochloa decumbens TaxID=240449 RepID=A0ABC9G875_9POAL